MSPRRRILLVAVLILAAAAAVSAGIARNRSALAAPRITGAPGDPTSALRATFTFRGRQTGVRFQCSLDGGRFAACSSPRRYAGLAQGRHRFLVRATLGRRRSDAVAWSWRVDRTPPPAPSLVQGPARISGSADATFGFTDAERGVAFRCRLDGERWHTCARSVPYRDLLDGTHRFAVRALDRAGNASAPTAASWLIDTVAPPAPTITGHPADPAGDDDADFTFADVDVTATFECRLSGGSDWSACSSPYHGAAGPGSNRFDVRARDAAGNTSDAATFTWSVVAGAAAPADDPGVPFSIAGDASGLLYPGNAVPVDLVFTNPNKVAITVTSVTTTISGTSTDACPAEGNFTIASQLAGPVVVPAGATASLSQLGVPQASWPQLAMVEPPADQDGCKDATVDLSYTGSAHS